MKRAQPVFREEIEERFGGHLSEEEIRMVRRAMRKMPGLARALRRRVKKADGGKAVPGGPCPPTIELSASRPTTGQ